MEESLLLLSQFFPLFLLIVGAFWENFASFQGDVAYCFYPLEGLIIITGFSYHKINKAIHYVRS